MPGPWSRGRLKVQTAPGAAAVAGDVGNAVKIGGRGHTRAQRNGRVELLRERVARPVMATVAGDVDSRLRARCQQPARRGGRRAEHELGEDRSATLACMDCARRSSTI